LTARPARPARTSTFHTRLVIRGAYVPWRRGWSLPRMWTSLIDREGAPHLVELEMGIGDDGPECRSYRCLPRDGGQPITPRSENATRGGRLGDYYIGTAIEAAAVRGLPSPDGQVAYALLGGDRDRTEPARLARSQGRSSVTLAEVALVYRDHGGVQAVREKLHVSKATAYRRIDECRECGLLPPKGG
jgi:hypothetical protein